MFLDNSQQQICPLFGRRAHPRQGFCFTAFPHIPVYYSKETFKTQRASRGKFRLLSAHDRQIYVTRPYDGYRSLSCVANLSWLCPASNLPALYPSGYGAYLYVDPRFCLRLPSGEHCCNTLASGYPSAPSAWVWTLPGTCVTIPHSTI